MPYEVLFDDYKKKTSVVLRGEKVVFANDKTRISSKKVTQQQWLDFRRPGRPRLALCCWIRQVGI